LSLDKYLTKRFIGLILNETEIKINCYHGRYHSNLIEMRKKFPNAYFEFIRRSPDNSVLAPSRDLLIRAGIFDKKRERMPFEDFKFLYKREIFKNKLAVERILFLHKLSKSKTVFLICVEMDPDKCHRSILKEIIDSIKIINFSYPFDKLAQDGYTTIRRENKKGLKSSDFIEVHINNKFSHYCIVDYIEQKYLNDCSKDFLVRDTSPLAKNRNEAYDLIRKFNGDIDLNTTLFFIFYLKKLK